MKRAKLIMRAAVSSAALAALMVFVTHAHLRAAADLCSLMIPNPYVRSEGETYFIGRASPDTIQVRISDVPGVLTPKRYPYRDSTPVFGQVVRVRSVDGSHADRVLLRFAAGDSTVVVIQYSFNSMCQTFPAHPGLDSGAYHYTAFLRPDSEWAAGRPTFDIKMVSLLAVYPLYLKRVMRDVNLDTTLTADEYASLVRVLPIEAAWTQDCRKELARLEAWSRSHESTAETYPANDALRVMRWHCRAIRHER